jgi:FG-GAP-like repeat/FG-GAP repeat
MRFSRLERTQFFAVTLLSLICLPAWSQSVSFQPSAVTIHFTKASNPTTGQFPQSVAIGDFNGDGKQDIAVPVTSPLSDLTILLGNGNGTFTEGPILGAVNENANNVVTADFNGDGKLDLAISLANFNQVQILLGNGDGSFAPLSPIPLSSVTFVATGDFNRDGKPDLAVVNGPTSSMTILLGNGDGTFTQKAVLPQTGGAQGIAIGDLNRDGIPDLAVINIIGQTVTILLGKGDGNFTQVKTRPATGIEPLSIAIGDFNGDGNPDLAVSNQNDGFPNLGTITLMLGNGKGNFRVSPVTLQTGSIPESVAVADFNGDGKPDLVTANAGSNTISVFLGQGRGQFAAPLTFPAGQDPLCATVGLFNGDKVPDLAIANNTAASLTILLGRRR